MILLKSYYSFYRITIIGLYSVPNRNIVETVELRFNWINFMPDSHPFFCFKGVIFEHGLCPSFDVMMISLSA